MSETERGAWGLLLLLLTVACVPAFCLFCGAISGEARETALLLYELSCSLLPWLAALGLTWRSCRKKEVALMDGTRWVWMGLFGVYLTLTFLVTGAGTLAELLYHRGSAQALAVNLAPFSQGIDWVGYLLNVLLGMPLGFLLPLLWDQLDRPARIVGAGLGFSLLIELSQLCNLRATDVDDLILNTAGTVLGWLLFRLFARIGPWQRERCLLWPLGPGTTVGLLFLGRFFLYQGSWMAWQLYGP